MTCHICGGKIELVEEYGKFERITSDCKKWKRGGKLGICTKCDNVVKVVDNKLRGEVKRIYKCTPIYQS